MRWGLMGSNHNNERGLKRENRVFAPDKLGLSVFHQEGRKKLADHCWLPLFGAKRRLALPTNAKVIESLIRLEIDETTLVSAAGPITRESDLRSAR